jgi:quercetin dioxygenase-like cupin family protein
MKKFALAAVLLVTTTAALPQDVVAANPKTIKVRVDNDKVRVLEATLPPGAKENLHSHPSSVVYIIKGGKVRNHAADGKVSEVTFKDNETVYRDPLTHYAENIGKTTIHLLVIELKK